MESDFSIVVVSTAITAGIVLAFLLIKKSLNKKVVKEKIDQLESFKLRDLLLDYNESTGIAIDEDDSQICLINRKGDSVDARIISYRDILSSEVFEDGDTLTSTSRSSQLAGTLIGGLALGGAGAVIGGLSGKKRSSDTANRLDLRLMVNDTRSPIHDVALFKGELKKTGEMYRAHLDKARHWHGVIQALIKQADREDAAQETTNAGTT